MKTRASSKPYLVERLTARRRGRRAMTLLVEEPLQVRLEDRPYSLIMRTPGEEVYHAAGFCLGEGLVDSAGDFKTIGYDAELDANAVDVWLKPARKSRVRRMLKRRWFYSHSSCGVCGKEMLEDLLQRVSPIESEFLIGRGEVFDCLDRLTRLQKLHRQTRSAHAALLLDETLAPVAFAEDVGRHNALDKAVGRALLERTLQRARVLVMSSRLSFELVQKAARARLPVVVSISRPTTLAVEVGEALGMTIAFRWREKLVVACGGKRIGGR